MVNQGTGLLSNPKVLHVAAPSFHNCFTLLIMGLTVLHPPSPWLMQLGLSITHFAFSKFIFAFLQTWAVTWDWCIGRSLGMTEALLYTWGSESDGAALPWGSNK